ncbi:MAG: polyamine aminopropyltransferase [Catalinimonas sp.]
MRFQSYLLKIALFATGLSGIVAEYILSTLATYFLGDSTVQWTMTVSVMLFSMGLGSRLSRYRKSHLLETFIVTEFVLSLLTAFASLSVYTLAAVSPYVGFFLYALAILIGLLIGLEIPLVIRLNDELESLRVNVSSVLEKDYYGSLLGGVFFAFVGLPFLGLTYTPFLLGGINLMVAVGLLWWLRPHVTRRAWPWLQGAAVLLPLALAAGAAGAEPLVLWGEQLRYRDQVVYAEQTRYQRIVITRWKDHHWLYLNGNQQLSTLDEAMYHEPLVHPALSLVGQPRDVLVLGGGDGGAVREVLKYPSVRSVRLVDLDPAMTELGRTHPVLLDFNEGALLDGRVSITNQDGYRFLEVDSGYYDAVIVDLPDPRTVELSRLYSLEFYELCARHLRPGGVLVTQAGSPYYATRAFRCVERTLTAAGFAGVPMHNQVLTMGEWGWIVADRSGDSERLKKRLQALRFERIPTRWINGEAMQLVTSFGKDTYAFPVDSVGVNRVRDPVLYRYYLDGNWDLY